MEYRLGEVRGRTGLSARQVRAWEAQGIVRPRRGAGNQRVYEEDDLARLERARRMRDAGLSLAEIKLALEVLDGRAKRREAITVLRKVIARIQLQVRIAEEFATMLDEAEQRRTIATKS